MDLSSFIDDTVRMMSYAGIPAEDARVKIRDAVMITMVQTMASNSSAPIPASQRAMPQVRFDPPNDPIVARPAAVDPVAAEATMQPGKTWRGTGKYAQGANGEVAEVGTWINPAGEIEAARLTRVTGIPHSIDPRTGDITRAGGGTVDVGAAPALIPDQKPIDVNPDALVQFDVRPVLNLSSTVPEPRHQIA